MDIISNRKETIGVVSKILKDEFFPINDLIINGIVHLIDAVSDYSEEGHRLFPDILLLNDEESLKSIPGRFLIICDQENNPSQFSKVLKLCAPLAINNWHIYIIIKDDTHIQYGILSTEIKETSVSLKSSFHSMAEEGYNIVYIRNVGGKNVEIVDKDTQAIISMELNEDITTQDDNINSLVNAIISDYDKNQKETLSEFYNKLIRGALDEGHGNLIAVCKKENFDLCMKVMSGGSKIIPAIDVPQLLLDDIQQNSNETSVAIKSYASVIKSMINHDGITIFSTEGQLLGFHFIVNNDIAQKSNAVGGSRTRAFEALKQIECLSGRFFKSQDGITKFA